MNWTDEYCVLCVKSACWWHASCMTGPQPRIFHPSPFLLTIPTPPKPSRTTNQSPVHETTSLISSAVNINPSCPVLSAGRATPVDVKIRRRTTILSTSISGRGNGTLSMDTTLGWCGVGERVATFRRTPWSCCCCWYADGEDDPDGREDNGGCRAEPGGTVRLRETVHVHGVSESSGSLSSPSFS